MFAATLRRISLLLLILAAVGAILIGIRSCRQGIFYAIGLGDRPVVHSYTQARYEATRERARALVAAVEQYKLVHGDYPQTLEGLVPEVLPRIDPPLVGDGVWQYTRREGGFRLTFFVGPIYEGDHYDSARGTWHVDR
jgi:hypothetical protein